MYLSGNFFYERPTEQQTNEQTDEVVDRIVHFQCRYFIENELGLTCLCLKNATLLHLFYIENNFMFFP